MKSISYNLEMALQQMNAGDAKGLASFYDEYFKSLLHFANSLVYNTAAAEDIVVEIFMKLWDRRGMFKVAENVKAFLYISTRNACLNHLRKSKSEMRTHKELGYLSMEGEPAEAEKQFDLLAIETEIMREILHEIRNLPSQMRKIFSLSFIKGLSTDQVATQLNLSPSTIRVQKANAVKMLKVALLKKGLLVFLFDFCRRLAAAESSLLRQPWI